MGFFTMRGDMARSAKRLKVAQVERPLWSYGPGHHMMDLLAGQAARCTGRVPPEPLVTQVRPPLPAKAPALDHEHLARQAMLEPLHG